jgi:hypothetical protein
MKEILGVYCKASNDACRAELSRLPMNSNILFSCVKCLKISYIYMAHWLNVFFMQQINQTRGLLRLNVFCTIWDFPFSAIT